MCSPFVVLVRIHGLAEQESTFSLVKPGELRMKEDVERTFTAKIDAWPKTAGL